MASNYTSTKEILQIYPRRHSFACQCSVLNNFERKEISFYSCDENNPFIPDESQIRYLHLPDNPDSVSFDLCANFETFIEAEYQDTIDRVIMCLQYLEKRGKEQSNGDNKPAEMKQDPDIITRRGLLAEIMRTPYTIDESWSITAIKYDQKIFLTRTFQPLQAKWGTPEQMKLLDYTGYKFEQYLSKKTPGDSFSFAEVNEVVDTRKAFYTLNRGKVGKHTLIYAGEVDSCYPESDGPRTYVEFKTSREGYSSFHSKRYKKSVHMKLLKWWAQSVLVGVPEIVCGIKNAKNVVGQVKIYQTNELPVICQDQWNPCVCFAFLENFLSYVKKVLADKPENPRVPYVFTCSPYEETVTYEQMAPDSEHCFLPKGYYSS